MTSLQPDKAVHTWSLFRTMGRHVAAGSMPSGALPERAGDGLTVLELPEETRRRYDTRSLRVVFSGGAPLSGPLAVEFMDAFGDVLYNFYGATETGLVTLAKPEDLRAASGTIGRAVPGNEIRLLDDGDSVDETVAGGRLVEGGEDAHGGGLAGPVGADEAEDLSRREREGDVVHRAGLAVVLAEVVDLDAHGWSHRSGEPAA